MAVVWPALKLIGAAALIFRMQTTTSDVTVFSHQWETQFQPGYEGLGIFKIVIGSKRRGNRMAHELIPLVVGLVLFFGNNKKKLFRFFGRGNELSSSLFGTGDGRSIISWEM